MPRTVNLTNIFMNRIDSELEKDVWMTQPVSYSGQRNASGGEMRGYPGMGRAKKTAQAALHKAVFSAQAPKGAWRA